LVLTWGYFSFPWDTGMDLGTLLLRRKQRLLSGASFVAVVAWMLELAGPKP